jgi:hypothetical protein
MSARLATRWQKSSYSSEGSNCLELAATPDGRLHLRESDEPDITLNTRPTRVRALLDLTRTSPGMY